VFGSELLDGTEAATAKFPRYFIRARQIIIYNPDQADSFALPCQLVINTSVIAPEGAHADHSDID
jgi:hypothetical protein